MSHFCLLSATDPEQDLALAELRALAGVEGAGRVLCTPRAVNVERAAYVVACAELLAAGPSPAALAEQLATRGLAFERFRITCVGVPPRPVMDGHAAIVEAARYLGGSVDLEQPLTELLLVGSEAEWYLGRVVSRASKSYRQHDRKPYVFSSSLPARIARAMVNLVAAPGDTVIDPCCGVGSILLEAWSAGMRAVGADLNRKLVGMTQANLRHFGRPPWVCVADAAASWARGDAVVTDFPYGRQSARRAGLYERLLAAFPSYAPRLAVVTAEDIEQPLAASGYEVLRVVRVAKSEGFARCVHLAKVT